jgi:predicted acylesterase/phospholipase RssA
MMLVAVNLHGCTSKNIDTAENKKTRPPGFIDMLNIAYDFTQQRLIQLMIEKHQPDILVDVPRNVCGAMDFHKTRELIEAGRAAFTKALNSSAEGTFKIIAGG